MRISTSFSDAEIILMSEILSKMMMGSDTKLLVKNATFPKLCASVQRLKERSNPDPSLRPPKVTRANKSAPPAPEPVCIGCTEDSGPDPECPKCGPTTAA